MSDTKQLWSSGPINFIDNAKVDNGARGHAKKLIAAMMAIWPELPEPIVGIGPDDDMIGLTWSLGDEHVNVEVWSDRIEVYYTDNWGPSRLEVDLDIAGTLVVLKDVFGG
jgi:hypothetical protein